MSEKKPITVKITTNLDELIEKLEKITELMQEIREFELEASSSVVEED